MKGISSFVGLKWKKEMDQTKKRFLEDVSRVNRLIEIEKEAIKLQKELNPHEETDHHASSPPNEQEQLEKKSVTMSTEGGRKMNRFLGNRSSSDELGFRFSPSQEPVERTKNKDSGEARKGENLDMLETRDNQIFKRTENDFFFNTEYIEFKKQKIQKNTKERVEKARKGRAQSVPSTRESASNRKIDSKTSAPNEKNKIKGTVPKNFVRKFRRLLIGSENSRSKFMISRMIMGLNEELLSVLILFFDSQLKMPPNCSCGATR